MTQKNKVPYRKQTPVVPVNPKHARHLSQAEIKEKLSALEEKYNEWLETQKLIVDTQLGNVWRADNVAGTVTGLLRNEFACLCYGIRDKDNTKKKCYDLWNVAVFILSRVTDALATVKRIYNDLTFEDLLKYGRDPKTDPFLAVYPSLDAIKQQDDIDGCQDKLQVVFENDLWIRAIRGYAEQFTAFAQDTAQNYDELAKQLEEGSEGDAI